MRTEKLDVDARFGEEYQGKYVLGEITWAKRNRIIQKYTKYSKLSGEVESSDFIGIQAETVMASLHGQPDSHPVTLEKLLGEDVGVPIELGELFSKVANQLNAVSQGDLRFLLEQLSEESRILLFKSFGFVKSSVGGQPSLPSNLPELSKNSVSS